MLVTGADEPVSINKILSGRLCHEIRITYNSKVVPKLGSVTTVQESVTTVQESVTTAQGVRGFIPVSQRINICPG